jgi:Co/Zn/Cd efflux system component
MGFVALCANLLCLVLLMRHRGDDLNMRSTWLCSRNDVVANAGVLAAAAGVALTQSVWPDLLVGVAIAAMFSRSAVEVIRASARALRASAARR